MRTLERLYPNPADYDDQLAAHLRLFHGLARMQNREAANAMMIELATHYRDLHERPRHWANLHRLIWARANRIDATEDSA